MHPHSYRDASYPIVFYFFNLFFVISNFTLPTSSVANSNSMTMKKILTLIFLTISVASYGQTGNWLWGRGATGTGVGQEGTGMTTDANGNTTIVGGYADAMMTFGNDTIMNSHISTMDGYVGKLSSSGNVLWLKSIGGMNSEIPNAVCTDAIGNVYVTGSSSSGTIVFDAISLLNGSSNGMFVVKYDINGNAIWAKGASGVNSTSGYGVSADSYGNIYVAGGYNDSVTFGATTLVSAGGQDAFLNKYDSNGNLVWAKSEGGTSGDVGASVRVDNGSNIIMVGYFTGSSITFGSFTLTNAGQEDIYVVKYDSSGTVLWAKSGNGNGDEYVQQVSTDFNGDVFVGGSFNSSSLLFGSSVLHSIGGLDAFIVKYNSSGNVIWAKSGGGNTNDYGFSVSADSSGNSYISGGFTDPSILFDSYTITAPAFTTQPMFIVKFDSSGSILCADALSCAGDDYVGVSVDNFGNAYISGDYSASPFFIIGPDTLTSYGLAFIAKYNCPASAGINELQQQENISIYPDPFTNQITFLLSNNDPTTLFLYDLLSRKILQQTFINSTTINTMPLAKGLYLYEVLGKDGSCGKGKVVKE